MTDELSPEDKAHVNRIVDRKMETMQREGVKLKSPMRAALGAIQQAEREEIRRQALRDVADLVATPEIIGKLRTLGRRERSAAILALIDGPATESVLQAEVDHFLKVWDQWHEATGAGLFVSPEVEQLRTALARTR